MGINWMWAAPVGMAVSVSASAAAEFSRQVPVGPRDRVEISNLSGEVNITGWDRREVDIRGELGSGVERVDVEQRGGVIEIEVVMKEQNWRDRFDWREGEARLEISVPSDIEVEATTVSGSITARGVRGEQALKSVSGNIRAEVLGTRIGATTVSGRVDLTGTGKEARVRASSVSGSVRLNRMGGDIEARTTSGDLDIDLNQATDLHATATSGTLYVRGQLARDGDVEASAVSGRIKITAQTPDGARYDASTFSGTLRNCFGEDPDQDDRRGRPRGARLSIDRGEGRATIRARTHSGSLDICDR